MLATEITVFSLRKVSPREYYVVFDAGEGKKRAFITVAAVCVGEVNVLNTCVSPGFENQMPAPGLRVALYRLVGRAAHGDRDIQFPLSVKEHVPGERIKRP